jgi:antitoxin YobK
MESFDELISRVSAAGEKIEFSGPQSVEAVNELERALAVSLPKSYRDFLLRYGAGGTIGSWIAGIYDNAPLQPNDGFAYGETMRIRKDYGLPDWFVVVQSSAPDVVWCLDTRKAKGTDHEAPVVLVDVTNGLKAEQVAPTFDAFFREYLEVRAEA